MKLVDSQEVIDALYDEFSYIYCFNCDKDGDEDRCGDECHRKYMNWSISKKAIERVINNLSTQTEIVTCDECKMFDGKSFCQNTGTIGFGPDDYCSMGERKC